MRMEQLYDCKGAFLRRTRHGNSDYYYYIKRPTGSSYNYVGRSSHREVSRICEARFLEEAIRRLDHNIDLVKSLRNNYLSIDKYHISGSLPLVYQSEVLPLSNQYKEKSTLWKNQKLEFQKEFPENYPQYKTYRTSDGVMVKTASEMVIYERFKDAGLTQIYELPFVPKDHGAALYPDFAVLSPIDMKSVIFVEYVGRMDLTNYRADFAKRTGRYIESGYVPGVNLFFIFADENGKIDSLQITKVIADIFGLRSSHLS